MIKKNIIVLFGSTGDLAFRKLLPAIQELYDFEEISSSTLVIAIGRRNFDNEEYFKFLIENNKDLNISILKKIVIYHKMEITMDEDYEGLKKILEENSNKDTRIIHYLAISPELVNDVIKIMSETNLIIKGNNMHSILFEKPFGQNLATAVVMNKKILENINENQIYRIDHYLTKNKIEKITMLKFKISPFDNFFKLDDIQEIKICITEKRGILNRGAYYDKTGAIKDMVQSHILQLLSILLIDKFKNYKNIADAKFDALKRIKFVKESLILGQYDGYLKEKNVAEKSNTETLVYCKFNYKKADDSKILITILTAKKTHADKAYFLIKLKDKKHCLKIHLNENNDDIMKKNEISTRIMISDDFKKIILKDYAKLIKNAIYFDKSTFLTQKEIEQSWCISDLILEKKNENIIYKKINDILSDSDFF